MKCIQSAHTPIADPGFQEYRQTLTVVISNSSRPAIEPTTFVPKAGHWTQNSVLVQAHFSGTPKDFDSRPEFTKWKGGQVFQGDCIVGADGARYRPVLVSANIVSYKNELPYRVGIKLNGMQTSLKTMHAIGAPVGINYALHANVVQPAHPNGINLYTNDWQEGGISYLVDLGWGDMTMNGVEKSIASKTEHAWHLNVGSPIMAYMVQNKTITPNEYREIVKDNGTKEIVVPASKCKATVDQMSQILAELPFHNPSQLEVSIHRMDKKPWSDNSGEFAHFNPKENANLHIDFKLGYQLFKISKNSNSDISNS